MRSFDAFAFKDSRYLAALQTIGVRLAGFDSDLMAGDYHWQTNAYGPEATGPAPLFMNTTADGR